MKLTNKFGLPTTIINVLRRPLYSKGGAHLSVTEMMTSPRIVQLRRRHFDDIEEDASELVWSVFGSAIHNILQHGSDENHIVEERLFCEIDGWSISGAIDLQEIEPDGVRISDYKCTSVWSVMNEKLDWQRQLNSYAYLVKRVKNLPIKELQIVAILRDWSAREAEAKDDYPRAPIVCISIPLWPFEMQEQYIKQRVHAHAEALFDAESGGNLSACQPEDMWERPTLYAIKKRNNKRATYVLKNEEEARNQVEQLGDPYEIEVRPGERVRCERFCSVSPWCDQYKTYLSEKANERT